MYGPNPTQRSSRRLLRRPVAVAALAASAVVAPPWTHLWAAVCALQPVDAERALVLRCDQLEESPSASLSLVDSGGRTAWTQPVSGCDGEYVITVGEDRRVAVRCRVDGAAGPGEEEALPAVRLEDGRPLPARVSPPSAELETSAPSGPLPAPAEEEPRPALVRCPRSAERVEIADDTRRHHVTACGTFDGRMILALTEETTGDAALMALTADGSHVLWQLVLGRRRFEDMGAPLAGELPRVYPMMVRATGPPEPDRRTLIGVNLPDGSIAWARHVDREAPPLRLVRAPGAALLVGGNVVVALDGASGHPSSGIDLGEGAAEPGWVVYPPVFGTLWVTDGARVLGLDAATLAPRRAEVEPIVRVSNDPEDTLSELLGRRR